MKQTTGNSYTSFNNVGSLINGLQGQLLEIFSPSPLQVGSTRQQCSAYLSQHDIASISFAHWLAIPSLQLLLVFRGQRCITIEKLITPVRLM